MESLVSHVSVGTNDLARATAFYDRVLPSLGARRVMEHDGMVAYGTLYPEFWVHVPHDGQRATVGNGAHVGFTARSREQVHAFYAAALAAGAGADGEPGPRPAYGEPYYGCFVRDPDGNKVEATFWDAPT